MMDATTEAVDAVDAVRGESLSRAADALAVAVDRLFVTELQRGLADEHTIELVASVLDLAAVVGAARAARSAGSVRSANAAPHARPDDAEVTCSG